MRWTDFSGTTLKVAVTIALCLCALPLRAAEVSQIKGPVQVKVPDSEWYRCSRGLVIKSKMTLKTGRNGRAVIKFGKKSKIIVLPKTEIYIEKEPEKILKREDAVHFAMEQGHVIVVNKYTDEDYDFRIATEYAAITARTGTFSLVHQDNKKSVLYVLKGKICAHAKEKKVCPGERMSTTIIKKSFPGQPQPAALAEISLWQDEDLLNGKNAAAKGLGLVIYNPKHGSHISRSEITLSGNTSPDASVKVNGVKVSVKNDGNFSRNLTLPEGKNTIKIEVRKGKKKIFKEVEVFVDSTPPLLNIEQPGNPFNPEAIGECDSKKCKISIYGLTEPEVVLLVNNSDMSKNVESNGSFFIKDYQLARGVKELTIQARSASGQTATQTLKVEDPSDIEDFLPNFRDMCPLDLMCH